MQSSEDGAKELEAHVVQLLLVRDVKFDTSVAVCLPIPPKYPKQRPLYPNTKGIWAILLGTVEFQVPTYWVPGSRVLHRVYRACGPRTIIRYVGNRAARSICCPLSSCCRGSEHWKYPKPCEARVRTRGSKYSVFAASDLSY